MITVIQDGDYLAIHPLLIRGYMVSVSAPAEAAIDEPLRVEATPQQLRGTELDHVEFIVTDGTDRVRKNATKSGDTYVADIDVSSLDPGSYEVYATVRGSNVVFGEAEFFGVNQGQQLDLVESAPTESGSSGGDSAGGGGGGGGATTATPTVTPTATKTEGESPTSTSIPVPSPSPSATPPSTETGSPIPSVTSDDDVVTPVSSTPTPSPTSGSGPGFGLLAALIALLGLMLRANWR